MFGWFWNIVSKKAVEPIKYKSMLITSGQLKKVATTLSHDRCEEMADLLNELGAKYGVVNKDVFHEFAANVIQESGEFAHKRENMSYSAKRMMQVWPSRFPNLASAQPYAHNPEKLSNLVYGKRMGNVQPGDGWAFRGGGFIGLTGREVYAKYAKYAGYTSVEACAEDVRNSDKAALDSAYWFFCVLKDLEDEADRDEMIGIIKSINGGLIGKDVRLMYYERCKKYIV
jgi:putative chitinase